MARRRSSEQVDGKKLRDLMDEKGWDAEQLAKRSGFSSRQIEKMMAGGKARLSTITMVAEALSVSFGELTRSTTSQYDHPLHVNEKHAYEVTINLKGRLEKPEDAARIAKETNELVKRLEELGVGVSSHESQAAIFSQLDTGESIILVLIFGQMENNEPFWVYVSVRPEMYALYHAAYKAKTLDLFNFSPFGEIVISGYGATPPEEIVTEVAAIYQADPRKMIEAAQNTERKDIIRLPKF